MRSGSKTVSGLARVPVEVDYASEWRYRDPILGPDTMTLLISQSGKTADTIAAQREAKAKVSANLLACAAPAAECAGRVFNCATGQRTTLNQTFDALKKLTGYKGSVKYGPERGGDIQHSLADITQAQKHLGYKVLVNFADGLRPTVEWYKNQARTVEA